MEKLNLKRIECSFWDEKLGLWICEELEEIEGKKTIYTLRDSSEGVGDFNLEVVKVEEQNLNEELTRKYKGRLASFTGGKIEIMLD